MIKKSKNIDEIIGEGEIIKETIGDYTVCLASMPYNEYSVKKIKFSNGEYEIVEEVNLKNQHMDVKARSIFGRMKIDAQRAMNYIPSFPKHA